MIKARSIPAEGRLHSPPLIFTHDLSIHSKRHALTAANSVRFAPVGYGRTVKAATWFGRTTVKWRRSTVAMSVMPRRSAVVMTEAATVPRCRSR
jgi:hypothetical protein